MAASSFCSAYADQDLMGFVAFGWMWLKMAAADKRELSGSSALRNKVEAGAETVMRMPEMAF